MSTPVVEIRGLRKTFGRRRALAGVDLLVTDKQIVFLFTLKDAATLVKLKGELKAMPGTSGAKAITNKNIMVLYGDIGYNHFPEVEAAIHKL